jgi:prepilin-type N-terminal cleavage/methylation domain-containing protein
VERREPMHVGCVMSDAGRAAPQRRRTGLRSTPRTRRGAFTLLETLMALVIIGVGVLAFVDAQASFMRSNNWSSQAATGMLLANEVREMARLLPRHDPVTGLSLSGNGPSAVLNGWGREPGELTVDDIDDLDDLDGMRFGLGGAYAGPVDAFGRIIPEITLTGDIRTDDGTPTGVPVSLEGWTKRVVVQKVDPYNFNTVRQPAYTQAASAQLPYIDVGDFPLRITVIVEYQPAGSTQVMEVTRVTWVASP